MCVLTPGPGIHRGPCVVSPGGVPTPLHPCWLAPQSIRRHTRRRTITIQQIPGLQLLDYHTYVPYLPLAVITSSAATSVRVSEGTKWGGQPSPHPAVAPEGLTSYCWRLRRSCAAASTQHHRVGPADLAQLVRHAPGPRTRPGRVGREVWRRPITRRLGAWTHWLQPAAPAPTARRGETTAIPTRTTVRSCACRQYVGTL